MSSNGAKTFVRDETGSGEVALPVDVLERIDRAIGLILGETRFGVVSIEVRDGRLTQIRTELSEVCSIQLAT
jgi:hypothetical protein